MGTSGRFHRSDAVTAAGHDRRAASLNADAIEAHLEKEKQRAKRRRGGRTAALACVVVLITAFALMLPAVSITDTAATRNAGFYAEGQAASEIADAEAGAQAGGVAKTEDGEFGVTEDSRIKGRSRKGRSTEIADSKDAPANSSSGASGDGGSDGGEVAGQPESADSEERDATIADEGAFSDEDRSDADGDGEHGDGAQGEPGDADAPDQLDAADADAVDASADAAPADAADAAADLAEGEGLEAGADSGESGVEADGRVRMPAQAFRKELKDADGNVLVVVSINAKEGALPEGTVMKAKRVTDRKVIASAKDKAVDETVMAGADAQALAIDITFFDKAGNQIEPARDVSVTMTSQIVGIQDQLAIVHVDDERKAEVIPARKVKPAQDQVTFDAAEFSVYAIVYTVDFSYDGYEFSLAGEGTIFLSELLDRLGISLAVSNIEAVEFSDPQLVRVDRISEPDGTPVDWQLVSLEPFGSNETLAISLSNGNKIVIDVTDAQIADDLSLFLKSATIYEEGNPLPWPATIHKNKEYDIRLSFEEGEAYQFVQDDTEMSYALPAGMSLGNVAFAKEFSMELDNGLSLDGNEFRYDPETNCIYVKWNTADSEHMALLNQSGSAEFFLDMKVKFDFSKDEIEFSESVKRKIIQDASYDVGITKEGVYDQASDTVTYTVTLASFGDSQNIDFWDTLEGTALAYVEGSVSYSGANGSVVVPEDPDDSSRAFQYHIDKMADGQVITFTYQASVDYSKLTGKGTAAETQNTATVWAGKERSATHSFEGSIDYITLTKRHGSEVALSGTSKRVPWTVTYNDSRKVFVEGETLADHIWAGAVMAMTYDTETPIEVVVKNKDGAVKKTYQVPWSDSALMLCDMAYDEETYKYDGQSWSYVIPALSDGLPESDGPYSYELTYYTIADQTKILTSDGYIGNEIRESKTKDVVQGSVTFPGTPHPLVVEKEATSVDADYIYWKVTFERKPWDLTRVVLEDTVPVLWNSYVEPIDDKNWTVKVEGLRGGEHCEQTITNRHAVFKFYRSAGVDEPGLLAWRGGEDAAADNTITITFRTVNDQTWVVNGPEHYWPLDHTNAVRLIANGQEASAEASATPRPMRVAKSGRQVGSVPDPHGSGVMLPLIRYELLLTGVTDDAFDKDGNLVIRDVYDTENLVPYVIMNPHNYDLNYSEESMKNYLDTYRTNLKRSGAYVLEHVWDAPYAELSKNLTVSLSRWWDWCLRQERPSWGGPMHTDAKDYVVGDVLKGIEFSVNKGAFGWDVADSPGRQTNEDGTYTYGATYRLPYYLVVKDAETAQRIAQELVDTDADFKQFDNRATWVNANHSDEASVDVEFKPVDKSMSYDSQNEQARYTVTLNPQKLRLNDGEVIQMTDAYENLAVDFGSITVETDPSDRVSQVDYAYHNNVGTFYIPDETRVTITYLARPIGERGKSVTFKNTASMLGYASNVEQKTTLSSDFQGFAGTYSLRLFKYEDNSFTHPLEGAVFQLFGEDADGNKVPITYLSASSSDEDDDRDLAQQLGYKLYDEAGGEKGRDYPTQANHEAGDAVYFTTHQNGYADVRLNMDRDGVALVKGKQYYLKEVETPAGHTSEDIYWKFIIGDMDYFNSKEGIYVYRNGGEMTVSNLANDKGLSIYKKVYGEQTLSWDDEKGISFRIEGRDSDSGELFYSQTVKYADFVSAGADGYRFRLDPDKLRAGKWTVTELKADMPSHARTTEVSMDGVEGSSTFSQDGKGAAGADPSVSFTINEDDLTSDYSKVVRFANTYKPAPVNLTVSKSWGDATSKLDGKSATFALLKNGKPYVVDGQPVTFSLPAENGEGVLDVWSKTVEGLDRYDDDGKEIAWSVREVQVRFGTGDDAVVLAGGEILDRFRVSATTGDASTAADMGADGLTATASYAADGTGAAVAFVNEAVETTQVRVKKEWQDASGLTEAAHAAGDVARFKLYRTTETIETEEVQAKDRETVSVSLYVDEGHENDTTLLTDSIDVADGDLLDVKVELEKPGSFDFVGLIAHMKVRPWWCAFPVVGVYYEDGAAVEVPNNRSSSNGIMMNGYTAYLDNVKTITVRVKAENLANINKQSGGAGKELRVRNWKKASISITNYTQAQEFAGSFTRENLEAHISAGKAEYIRDITVTFSGNGTDDAWTYARDLPKADEDGHAYTYFVVEETPAGYEDASYSIDEETGLVTAVNRKLDVDPGMLKVSKQVSGLPASQLDTNKLYYFRVRSGGMYLKADGTLVSEDAGGDGIVHVVRAGEDGAVTFDNVTPGTYVVEELFTQEGEGDDKSAWVDGYTLSVSSGEAVVESGSTAEVTLKNSYISEVTDFTFGKVWLGQDASDAAPIEWPDDKQIRVHVLRRPAAQDASGVQDGQVPPADEDFELVYTIGKDGKAVLDEQASKTSAVGDFSFSVADVEDGVWRYRFTLTDLPKKVLSGDYAGADWTYYAVEETVPEYATSYGWIDGENVAIEQSWQSAQAAAAGAQLRYIVNKKAARQVSVTKEWYGPDLTTKVAWPESVPTIAVTAKSSGDGAGEATVYELSAAGGVGYSVSVDEHRYTFTFFGLDPNCTYTFSETPIAGYHTDYTLANGTRQLSGLGYTDEGGIIRNSPVTRELPNTGGPGTWPFVALGLFALGAGLALLRPARSR